MGGRSGGLLRYAVRRGLQAIPLVLVIIVLNFVLVHSAPGDPVTFLAGQYDASPEYLQQLRVEFGLDKPLTEQLTTYLRKVAQGDLGYSLRYRQSVASLIISRLYPTLLLMGSAFLVASALGIYLGVQSARKPYSAADTALTVGALAGYSMPVFWLGQVLLIVFSLWLGWFPTQGMNSLRAPSYGMGKVLDVLQHLILPALTYSVYHLILVYRLTRGKMREVLGSDFIMTARAKGVVEETVVFRHALRNALLPVVTALGINFGFMLAGSALVETVYGWPGLGRLMFEAINARDYPVLMGIFLVASCMVILANLLTDLVYAVIDPRITY